MSSGGYEISAYLVVARNLQRGSYGVWSRLDGTRGVLKGSCTALRVQGVASTEDLSTVGFLIAWLSLNGYSTSPHNLVQMPLHEIPHPGNNTLGQLQYEA